MRRTKRLVSCTTLPCLHPAEHAPSLEVLACPNNTTGCRQQSLDCMDGLVRCSVRCRCDWAGWICRKRYGGIAFTERWARFILFALWLGVSPFLCPSRCRVVKRRTPHAGMGRSKCSSIHDPRHCCVLRIINHKVIAWQALDSGVDLGLSRSRQSQSSSTVTSAVLGRPSIKP